MNSDNIRETHHVFVEHSVEEFNDPKKGLYVDGDAPEEIYESMSFWLKEIAFQLAVNNERNNQKDKH